VYDALMAITYQGDLQISGGAKGSILLVYREATSHDASSLC